MSPKLFCGALKCQIANVCYKKWEGGAGVSAPPRGQGLFSACCMCTRLFPYVRPFDELPTCQGCTPPPLAFSPEGSSSAPETPLRYKTADDERMDGIIMLLDRKQKTSLAYIDIRG